jgi:hypothetical protein
MAVIGSRLYHSKHPKEKPNLVKKSDKKKPRKDLSEERGEYRPIYTVLIHGPDYQALSPTEKLVLLHLKLNLGPAGIGILYPSVLAEQTGYPEDGIRLAIDILSHRGWVSHERNVFWVVDGLKYEPSLSKNNVNHRGWLARYLKGLPKLLVVTQFGKRYADWLPAGWDGMGDGMPLPMPITSTSTTTITNTTQPPPAKRVSNGKYPHYPMDLCQRQFSKWVLVRGGEDFASFRKALSPFYPATGPTYPELDIEFAFQAFADVAGSQPPEYSNSWNIRKLAGDMGRWVRLGKMPKQTDTGELTELGRLIAA